MPYARAFRIGANRARIDRHGESQLFIGESALAPGQTIAGINKQVVRFTVTGGLVVDGSVRVLGESFAGRRS